MSNYGNNNFSIGAIHLTRPAGADELEELADELEDEQTQAKAELDKQPQPADELDELDELDEIALF